MYLVRIIPSMGMKRYNVHLTDSILEALRKTAREQEVTVASIIRQILKDWARKHR